MFCINFKPSNLLETLSIFRTIVWLRIIYFHVLNDSIHISQCYITCYDILESFSCNHGGGLGKKSHQKIALDIVMH